MFEHKNTLKDSSDASEPQSGSVRVHALVNCARCGNNHDKPIEFEKLVRPLGDLTHWAPCPTNGQPILLRRIYKKGTMVINRVWAMPNKWTFKIPPIAELIKRYVGNGEGWIDPFAGENSPAEITNDINPKRRAKYHLHAKEFAETIEGKFNGCLFDPPYSARQVKECYDNIGIELFSQEDTNHFPGNVKRELAPKIKLGGYCITFGWNSQGFGRNLGFEIREILLVAHGSMHNDTIVVVDQKITDKMNLISPQRKYNKSTS